jgi:hypothetical protein
MKLPRLTIRRQMVVVLLSAFAAWGWVSFAKMDHFWTSVVLGILLGAASLVVPLVAVCIILHFNPRWYRLPVAPDPPEPEAAP